MTPDPSPNPGPDVHRRGNLDGVRIIEIADEQAEYCGLVLAGLGADVIKVEPVTGNRTRRIGPFLDDSGDPEESLYFWHYNRGKRSVAIDLETEEGRGRFRDLVTSADLVLDSTPRQYLADNDLALDDLRAAQPSLITARITPFGDSGPRADWTASDLIHLALGGTMMNCGYDPRPDGTYDLPPIAGQMWHAYHVTGEQMAMMITGALVHRQKTAVGQHLSCAVHEAVAKSTEIDLMSWVMRAAPLYRQTCRHAAEVVSPVPTIARTKDGRWIISQPVPPKSVPKLLDFLDRYEMGGGLRPEWDAMQALSDGKIVNEGRAIPGTGGQNEFALRCQETLARLWGKFTYDEAPWREAQDAGFMVAPLRMPEECMVDPHWRARGTFGEVEHTELGRSFTYVLSKWLSNETSWQVGRRAPHLGEDGDEVAASLAPRPSPVERAPFVEVRPRLEAIPAAGERPFPLEDVRIFDFSWFLASAGGTRFLASLGAQVIKVEWAAHPDTRMGAMAPVGGRAAREGATGPLPGVSDSDMGGQFNNKNAGKRGLSLNVRDPRGMDIARRLIGTSDIVAEGFSPGVLDRWGLGYDELRRLKPDIIYAQQSGAGSAGVYGRFRSVGPVAAAFAGTSEMSGLPDPCAPAGWGYSYLDWLGAYSFGLAMLSALHHRNATGRGQWIDASQCEAGLFAGGTSYLDWSANGRPSTRTGNRSPNVPAAPHGAYRCDGTDKWLAIASFDEEQWKALCAVAGDPDWAADVRFATLESRIQHQDELDLAIERWTVTQSAEDLMVRLQNAGVPAGVCQTAADRCDSDPQLAHLEWLAEVPATKIGTWPIAEVPVKFSQTQATVGGTIGRGAPCYGEDNEYVLGELLGLSSKEIADLAADGVI